jgi:hypothetical protein
MNINNQTLLLVILGLLGFYFFVNQESFSNTCDKDLCNTKMKGFIIDNNWSFKNSSINFKECSGCKARWYRSSEYKTSDDGLKWIKHSNAKDAYNDIIV